MSDGGASPKPVKAEAPADEEVESAQANGSADTKETEQEEVKDVKAEEGDSKKEDVASSDMLKTTAKTDYSNLENNRKFDPTTREVTDDPSAIRKQVRIAKVKYHGTRSSQRGTRWNFILETGTFPRTSSCGRHARAARTSPCP